MKLAIVSGSTDWTSGLFLHSRRDYKGHNQSFSTEQDHTFLLMFWGPGQAGGEDNNIGPRPQQGSWASALASAEASPGEVSRDSDRRSSQPGSWSCSEEWMSTINKVPIYHFIDNCWTSCQNKILPQSCQLKLFIKGGNKMDIKAEYDYWIHQ